MTRPRKYKGFTLVELLVVIGIVALLISILFPALNAVKVAAKGAKCLSNLRGIALAEQIYASNNRGSATESMLASDNTALFKFPANGSAAGMDYFVNATSCPAWYDYIDMGGNLVAGNTTGGAGYGWNAFMPNGTKLSVIRDPSEVVMWADTIQTDNNGAIYLSGNQGIEDPFWAGAQATSPPTASKPLLPNFHGRHGGGAGSVLWCDGHASKVVATKVPGSVSVSTKFGCCHQPAAFYNQHQIGYLVRAQSDLFSTAGEYYFQSHKELLPANNVLLLLMLAPPPAPPGTYIVNTALWQ
jgi:prepilin-type N-terminal cleavage/methylation domain-containing protein/prepilin-type processing-associated H-X9-DG protein